mmetsp:Transcript_9454/g.26374  ORF Transcript_9454/g.26374 Transcript_9454/m.26374 type:complete len:197 (-) Transcript_9454:227-817(-)
MATGMVAAPDPAHFDEAFLAKRRVYTEVFLVKRDFAGTGHVLLGRKKRGFKEGLLFGFGGKVEAQDASTAAAAVRELREESGIDIDAAALEEVGVVWVQFQEPETKYLEIHAFRADVQLLGEEEVATEVPASRVADAVETSEMKPLWVDIGQIPWDECLPDVRAWYPLAIGGAKFSAQFVLGAKDEVLWERVQRLE